MKDRIYKIEGCFMDDAHRFAFIHIYKNASISMRNVLGIRGKYYRYEDVKDEDPVTICIVRNPIHRAMSSFFYLFRLEDNGFPDQHPTHVTRELDFFKEPDRIKGFDMYLDYIAQNGFYDAVTLPQVDFIADRGLTVMGIDVLMVQEDMDNCYESFRLKYGLPAAKFPVDNAEKSPDKQLLYDHVMQSSATQGKIYDLYEEDFKMYFGYATR